MKNPKLEIPMDVFNAFTPEQKIAALCAYHGCNEKKQQLHKDAFVKDKWNPHPPQRFIDWWENDGAEFTEKKTETGWKGTNTATAFNCQRVSEAYREAKSFGLA